MQIEDLITFGFLADIDEESRSLTHGCRKDWERSEKLRGFKRWRNRIDSIRRTQGFFCSGGDENENAKTFEGGEYRV